MHTAFYAEFFNELHCVPKNVTSSTLSRCYSNIHESILILLGTNVTEHGQSKGTFFSLSHVNIASAIPGEIKTEIASFHLNAACFFARNT